VLDFHGRQRTLRCAIRKPRVELFAFGREIAGGEPAAVDDGTFERATEHLARDPKLRCDLLCKERLELGAPRHRIAPHHMAKPLVAAREELRDVADRHFRVVVEAREQLLPCDAAGVGIGERGLCGFQEQSAGVVHRLRRCPEPAHERRLPARCVRTANRWFRCRAAPGNRGSTSRARRRV
jgi:hypothetical protein